MKKQISTLILILGLSPLVFSQTKSTIEFNATVGYNGATVQTTNLHADYRSGFNAGVGGEYYFSERWGLKAKLLYDQKGWANGYINTATATTTTDFHLDYLTVPVLANWHFGRTKNWYLNFGPYIGFLLSAKTSVNSLDVKSIFNDTDGGLDVGIGVRFPVSDKTKFFIEINGQSGVVDISKGSSDTAINNTVSAINIGFNFY